MMKLPANERRAYQRYLDDLSYQASMVESSYGIGRKEGIVEGRVEGRVEGIEEGKEEATIAMVRALKQQGVPLDAFASGLSIEAINKL